MKDLKHIHYYEQLLEQTANELILKEKTQLKEMRRRRRQGRMPMDEEMRPDSLATTGNN